MTAPTAIPNDGPADIDYASRQAPMHEGEVFGEMSCMTLAPRSATVIADHDCQMLEFTRNIFDQVQKDAGYRERADRIYRARVLDGHLRGLAVFAGLSPEDLEFIHANVELEVVEPGSVICDEGADSDGAFIIRSGMVQVVTGTDVALQHEDILDWNRFCAVLVESLTPATKDAATPIPLSPQQRFSQALPVDLQAMLPDAAKAADVDRDTQERLRSALNELTTRRELLASKEFTPLMQRHEMLSAVHAFPKGVKGIGKAWSELDIRVAGRLLVSALFPECIAGRRAVGPPRIINYLARGDIFGEMGVLTNQPRNATCIAYDHPGDDPNRKPGRVELVRIRASVFHQLMDRSATFRGRLEKLVAERRLELAEVSEAAPWEGGTSLHASPEFQRQGLVQGQKLLLIDLDRCTRCGDCVQACINTHDDGYSRLFLDGPRFDRFLVPSACRQCLNPACLIGCPVGSIQRGDNGQILIRDWCIGCEMCARQCPYDSIQMHDIGAIPDQSFPWRWLPAGQVAGDRWMERRFGDRRWLTAAAPFHWDWQLQAMLATLPAAGEVDFAAEMTEALYFRHAFELPAAHRDGRSPWQLVCQSRGSQLRVWLNGCGVDLQQDAKQQKRGEYQAQLDPRQLGRANVLAVEVQPPVPMGEVVLAVRLDAVPQTADPEHVEVKLVTSQAVVCDLCSSLPSQRPASVDMCPHEAAIRINARDASPLGWGS